MDINKYKNMSLKLMEELKKHGINKNSIKIDQNAGTGLKEEKDLNSDLLSVSNDDMD